MRAKLYCVILLLGLLFALYSQQTALASVQVDSFSFVKEKQADIVGEGRSLLPDGKPDVNFFLSLRGVGIISQIQLKNLSNGQTWDTNANAGHRVLLVQSKTGEILNDDTGMKNLFFLFGIQLSLWVNDQASVLSKNAEFEVTVYFMGGSVIRAKTNVVAQPPLRQEATKTPSAEIISAIFLGPGSKDIVGPGPKIKPNGVNDSIVVALIRANGMITGFRLTNTAGDSGEWDTLPESPFPILAVTGTDKKLISFPDGNVRIPIKGVRTFYLWLENNGTLGKASTRSKLIATLADGRIMERAITLTAHSDSTLKVISADYRGVSGYDFVGPSVTPGSNLNADLRFDLTIQGKGILTGVSIQDINHKYIWDTDYNSPNWLVGVTKQDTPLLNEKDGSISVPVKGTTFLSLWIEPKYADSNSGRYQITLTWEDGRIMQVQAR